jgi:hypothetical protein
MVSDIYNIATNITSPGRNNQAQCKHEGLFFNNMMQFNNFTSGYALTPSAGVRDIPP